MEENDITKNGMKYLLMLHVMDVSGNSNLLSDNEKEMLRQAREGGLVPQPPKEKR